MASRSSRQPTLREVAVRAGVSPMTVSRTLAGGTHVRPDLQERVRAAVAELGYQRNENARSIRPGQQSGLIGVVITNLANPYYGRLALGIEEIAAQHGKRIILGNTGEDPERERRLIADFVGRQVDGIVLVPSSPSSEHLRSELLRDTPVVLASRRVYGLDVDTVLLDDVGGAFRGTAALIEQGHRRIAYLGNVVSVFTGQRRYDGFERAHAEHGLAVDPDLVHRGQQDVEAAAEATAVLLEGPEPPTALFCANNRNTVGALQEYGRRLAAGAAATDLPALTGFDDFELSGLMPVPIAVIEHDARVLGREAGELLFARLSADEPPPARTVELPVRLVGQP